jgi:hypothetical protein
MIVTPTCIPARDVAGPIIATVGFMPSVQLGTIHSVHHRASPWLSPTGSGRRRPKTLRSTSMPGRHRFGHRNSRKGLPWLAVHGAHHRGCPLGEPGRRGLPSMQASSEQSTCRTHPARCAPRRGCRPPARAGGVATSVGEL